MKQAVVYYSLDGNTREAAEALAKTLAADLFAIETAEPMPKSNWARILHGGRLSTFGSCPPIKPMQFDPAAYDRIILGTPVWAWKCAAPVRSFLTQFAVDEKVQAVFTCSGGADDTKCIADLKKILHHIAFTVTLADRKHPQASENKAKLEAFAEKLK